MCRALTEEVVEKHYLDQNEISEIMSRSRSATTPLSAFIKAAEDRHSHVKKHNLKAKVLVANEVLHKGRLEISLMQKWKSPENLIREWILSLKVLIEKAPLVNERT
jgi:hypothetical protein